MRGTFLTHAKGAAGVPVLGAWTLVAVLGGCGKNTDPDAVGLDELKFASGLTLVDKGNGTVRLKWSGINNEKDFSGYNIYGVKDNADIQALAGKVVKLLDDKGEVVADGKATLAKMNYNGSDWETAGASATGDDAGDLQVVPYYKTKSGDDYILPSCMPKENAGTGTECVAVEAEGGEGTFNGTTWFDVTGLKADGRYCFTVLSSLDDGKKVSMTTSEVRCVTPKSKVSVADAKAVDDDAATHGSISYMVDLEALRTACATGTCGDLAVDVQNDPSLVGRFDSDDERAADGALDCGSGGEAKTPKALCIERFGDKANFTAGLGGGVSDLGWYPLGFDDPTLPSVPALSSSTDVQNKDGYSLAGQSLPLEDDHIYAVASPVEGATNSYHYDLIFVSGMTGNGSGTATTFDMELRMSGKANER